MVRGAQPSRPKKHKGQPMLNAHDPLAERHRADRAQEEDYFRTLDQELIAALCEKSAAETEQVIRQYTRMRCPKCGEPLKDTPSQRVKIDACPGCGGIWLDKGAWEGLVGPQAPGWLHRLFAGVLSR